VTLYIAILTDPNTINLVTFNTSLEARRPLPTAEIPYIAIPTDSITISVASNTSLEAACTEAFHATCYTVKWTTVSSD